MRALTLHPKLLTPGFFDNKRICLVDYENCPTFHDKTKFDYIIVFVGLEQAHRYDAQQYLKHGNVSACYMNDRYKNYLDTYLMSTATCILTSHKPVSLTIYSEDHDYDGFMLMIYRAGFKNISRVYKKGGVNKVITAKTIADKNGGYKESACRTFAKNLIITLEKKGAIVDSNGTKFTTHKEFRKCLLKLCNNNEHNFETVERELRKHKFIKSTNKKVFIRYDGKFNEAPNVRRS